MASSIYESFCGAWLIRLLEIHPYGDDCSSSIHCSLTETSFTEDLKYVALSYTWGSQETPCQIYVNDHEVHVGENLHMALCDLRLRDRSRIMWIDALCINQEDDEEKLFQIEQMDLVYSRATMVIAYLGRFSNPPSPKLSSAVRRRGPRVDVWSIAFALFKLTHPYWTRLWIVQEVVLAKQLCLQITLSIIPWDGFLKSLPELADELRKHLQEALCLQRQNYIRTLADLRIKRLSSIGKLENLIETFQEAECYNSVDKIYGLMGLANDYDNRDSSSGPGLFGSYDKPRSKVFAETLGHFQRQYLIKNVSGHTLECDRSLRLMRHSELLLRVLQDGFDDEAAERHSYIEDQYFNVRAQVIGMVENVLSKCQTPKDIERC
jgi:hypothetical protein